MKKKPRTSELIVTINDYGYADSKFTKRELGDDDQSTGQGKVVPTVQCSVCGKMVRKDRLAAHRKNAHVAEDADRPSFVKANQDSVNINSPIGIPLSQASHPVPQVQKSISATSPGQELLPCAYCNALVLPKNMAKHLRKKHQVATSGQKPGVPPKKPASIRVPTQDPYRPYCPKCKRRVSRDKLQAHLRKEHGIWVKRNQRNTYRTLTARSKPSRESTSDRLNRQGLVQSSDEPFDGGKHWGHITRENGRFGSTPLHDDYSEESSP